MSEIRALIKSSVNETTSEVDKITFAKRFYVTLPDKVRFQQHYPLFSAFSYTHQQTQTKSISTNLGINSCLQKQHDVAGTKREEFMAWQASLKIATNNTSLVYYHQRWQQEVYKRFQESKKRFPEFFPCFELKYSLVAGLQYSIHFKPLTKHAEDLSCNAPLFPTYEEFKPIEQLWNEDGQSTLDIIFENFPTQLTLMPLDQQSETKWWKSVVELVKQRLELKHIGSLLVRKNA